MKKALGCVVMLNEHATLFIAYLLINPIKTCKLFIQRLKTVFRWLKRIDSFKYLLCNKLRSWRRNCTFICRIMLKELNARHYKICYDWACNFCVIRNMKALELSFLINRNLISVENFTCCMVLDKYYFIIKCRIVKSS